MEKSFRKNGSGFTILELIIATFVLTVGVLGTYSIVANTTANLTDAGLQLTGAYLAQEGIEIVRNERDANWVKGQGWQSWKSALGAGGYEADYNDTAPFRPWNGSGTALNLETASGLYGYDPAGTPTPFKRKITIAHQTDFIEVSVQVLWASKGKNYSITAQENLYGWYQKP